MAELCLIRPNALSSRTSSQNAVSANSNGVTYTNLTFRAIEVGRTGGTGECFYLGCSDDKCRVNGALIESCYCHDTCVPSACTGGSQGSAFQVHRI